MEKCHITNQVHKQGLLCNQNGFFTWQHGSSKQDSLPPHIHLAIFSRRRSQDGGGIAREHHFLPHKYIRRLSTRGATSTKQLLNAGRGPQIPRKATPSLQNEVGQKIKTKRETENSGKEIPPG